jgi:hypothetical protein
VCERGSARTLSHYGFRVGSGAVFTLVPERRSAVIILANRNGGIFGRTESTVLGMLVPSTAPAGEPASAPAPQVGATPRPALAGARAAAHVVGVYVSGADTLHLEIRSDSLRYRYRKEVAGAAVRGDTVDVLDESRATVQQFFLVRGSRTRAVYLHDGLNAFRRLR